MSDADVRRVPDLRADGPAGRRSPSRWTQHGHHDLDGHGRGGGGRPGGRAVPTAQSDRHPGIGRRRRAVPAAGAASDTVVLLDEAYIEFVAARAPHRRAGAGPAFPECRGAADLLEGLRAGRAADRLRVRRARAGRADCGRCSCRSAWASPAWSRSRPPTTPKTSCGNAFGGSPPSATTCGCGCGRWVSTAPTRTPTSSTCRRRGGPGGEVFDRGRPAGPLLRRRRRADHRRRPAVHPAVLAAVEKSLASAPASARIGARCAV